MKKFAGALFPAFLLAMALASLPWFTGCQSKPRIDWASRVGNYTFDQAVTEMGPPDKSSKLTDGTLVAEWLQTRQAGGFSVGIGTGVYGRHGGVSVGQSVGTGSGARFLRLTFGPDGKLTGYGSHRR